MAIRKINYHGTSKILLRLCEAVNSLIESGGGGGSKHTIINKNGTAMSDRAGLQFTGGATVTDDSVNDKTVVQIPAKVSDLQNDSGFITGVDIEDIGDVNLTNLANGQVLKYNSTSQKWENSNESGATYTEGDGIDISAQNEISVDTAFSEASTRTNIASGDTVATILGKIKKFFTDLKSVAFSGSYNDLSDQPTIPDTTDLYNNHTDKYTRHLTSSDDLNNLFTVGTYNSTGGSSPQNSPNTLNAIIKVEYHVTENTYIQTFECYASGVCYTYKRRKWGNNAWGQWNLYYNDNNPPSWNSITDKPTIPDISGKVDKSGDTMTGRLNISQSNNDSPLYVKGDANGAFVGFQTVDGVTKGWIGVKSDKKPYFFFNSAKQIALLEDFNSIALSTIGGEGNQCRITNFKTKFFSYRNPILCWYADQGGLVYVFVIYTGQTSGTWNLGFTNILNAGALSAADLSFSGNDLIISNLGNWGYGTAVGISVNF